MMYNNFRKIKKGGYNMKNYMYEKIERTEDGRWAGYIKEGYMTEYETITVFADTKNELLEEQKYFIKE